MVASVDYSSICHRSSHCLGILVQYTYVYDNTTSVVEIAPPKVVASGHPLPLAY
jgi:hypothetical protein